MPSIQDLREKRAAKATEARQLLDANPGAKWNSDHQAAYDALIGEIGDTEQQITNHERLMDLEADTRFDGVVAESTAKARRDRGLPQDANDPTKVFSNWIRGGDKAVSAEQWSAIRNTMSTTTGSEGGYTVPSLIGSQVIDAMKAFGTMRAVSETISTQNGQALSFPTSDGTSETGEWVAQNTTATASDASFGTVSLNVFKVSSKIIAVPFELLQDSTVDMIPFLTNRIAQRLGRIGNTGFTVGTGTTQPDGIVPKASSGKVGTTGQTTTIIYDDIIDLMHAVDPSYRGSRCAFMAPDALLKVLRKLKDTAGRPIWTPSYDSGITLKNPSAMNGGFINQNTPQVYDTLLGFDVWVNNDMAAPAANAKSLVFGDFSYYKIRDAMGITLFRFDDSAYAKLGQIGFLAWARMGGNLVDTNAVKYYQHSAT